MYVGTRFDGVFQPSQHFEKCLDTCNRRCLSENGVQFEKNKL